MDGCMKWGTSYLCFRNESFFSNVKLILCADRSRVDFMQLVHAYV